jgi:adenylyltransferase/sulfurtransferase
VPNCAEAGVLGVLPGLLGTAMAVEAVKMVTGIGTTMLGRVATYDALSARWWEIPLSPTPGRPPVTALAAADDGAPACSAPGPGPAPGSVPVPGSVPTVTAPELAELLAARERGAADFELVDVREPYEARLAAIPGARLVPLGQFESGEAFARIAPGRRVLLHCKAGARSERALRLLRAAGHPDVAHLEGGVLAWIEQVDPSQRPY